MTYKKHKTLEFVLATILMVSLLILLFFEIRFLVTSIAISIIFACMIANLIVYRRAYPQWKGYEWWMPWKIIVLEIVIFISAAALDVIYSIHIGACSLVHIVLFISILINAAYDDLYCTTKYEMDRFTSVQELFAAYPEARQRFQRGLFTKGRKKK